MGLHLSVASGSLGAQALQCGGCVVWEVSGSFFLNSLWVAGFWACKLNIEFSAKHLWVFP